MDTTASIADVDIGHRNEQGRGGTRCTRITGAQLNLIRPGAKCLPAGGAGKFDGNARRKC